MQRLIELVRPGYSIVVLDHKGAPELFKDLKRAVEEAKIPWSYVTLRTGSVKDDDDQSARPTS